MNLDRMCFGAIGGVVRRTPIQIYVYNGQTVDANGIATANYDAPFSATAQVQFTARYVTQQELEHLNGFDKTRVYKDFRIQSSDLTGLNRNLSTGGDYIVMNGLYYRIIAFPENFTTNWVWVVGCESTSLESS